MRIEIFVLCDAATEQQGKMNILGAFDAIFSRKTPTVHPQCTVALRMRFSRIESGAHQLRINIIDGDGHPIMPTLNAPINVQIKAPEESAVTHIFLNIQQLKLEKFGRYSVDVAIDGRQEGSLPLFVRQIPEPVSEPRHVGDE